MEARRIVEIQVSANAGYCTVGAANLCAGKDKLSFVALVCGWRD